MTTSCIISVASQSKGLKWLLIFATLSLNLNIYN